jgi:hypothetical protein
LLAVYPGGRVLYVSDTEEKWSYLDSDALTELGLTIEEHEEMPDVVVHHREKNRLFLIEAVGSHGPVSPERRQELKELFAGSKAGIVYVTAFLDRRTMMKSTCPPIARDRLTGLAGVSKNLVLKMDRDGEIPPRMKVADLLGDLEKIGNIIEKMADPDIFVWLARKNKQGTKEEIHRAATIVADRLCGSMADPIIRNAQERRQLAAIQKWLEAKGYRALQPGRKTAFPFHS